MTSLREGKKRRFSLDPSYVSGKKEVIFRDIYLAVLLTGYAKKPGIKEIYLYLVSPLVTVEDILDMPRTVPIEMFALNPINKIL